MRCELLRPAVLAYHQVACPAADADPLRLAVSPQAFEAQMRDLARAGFRTVPLDEALRPGPGRRVAITFDDGYLDTYTTAYPALRRHGFTATVFLVTARVGGMRDWDGGTPVPLLSWSHAEEMARDGISFQSHTRTHADLTRCGDEAARDEIAGSRAELEDRLGRPVTALAYPFGRFRRRTVALVRAAGYTSGWAAGMSRAGRLGAERLQISARDGRVGFAVKASGCGAALRRALHFLRASTSAGAAR